MDHSIRNEVILNPYLLVLICKGGDSRALLTPDTNMLDVLFPDWNIMSSGLEASIRWPPVTLARVVFERALGTNCGVWPIRAVGWLPERRWYVKVDSIQLWDWFPTSQVEIASFVGARNVKL